TRVSRRPAVNEAEPRNCLQVSVILAPRALARARPTPAHPDRSPRRRPPERAAVVPGRGRRPSSSSPVSAARTGAFAGLPRCPGSGDGDHRSDGFNDEPRNCPRAAGHAHRPHGPGSHAPAEAAVSVKVAGPPKAGVSGTFHITLPPRPTKTNCRARISWRD